jgi:membrane-bound metal-dependent hydrolase YbcI (DUF457 family)
MIVFAGLGVAADLDLLFGAHGTYAHSVGAALVVGLAAFALLRGRHALVAVACAAAYGSHVLLDWLGEDSSPPIGIMALWPFSRAYYHSYLDVFMGIMRQYWRPGFLQDNLRSISREVLTLAPIAIAAWWLRRPR